MFKKVQAVLALFCTATYAAAGTTVLGTASVRGEMRVDGTTVQGDATVFNGSVVETQDASAVLRIAHGVDITMSKSSRGTVFDNRFVLQRGETRLSSSIPFELEAKGLHVTAGKSNSLAVVTLKPNNSVEVASLAGIFEIRDDQGLLLSNVLPNRPLTFAIQAQANTSPYSISTVGILENQNGHYYLTTDENVKYELAGQDLQKFVGDKVVVSGVLQPASQPGGLAGAITVKTIQINGGNRTSRTGKWLIIGTTLGGAATVGWVIYNAEQPSVSQ